MKYELGLSTKSKTMSKDDLSRKDFLKRLSMLGLIGTGTGSLLAACSSGNKKGGSSQEAAQGMSSDTSGTGKMAAAADPCTDISSLNDQQKQMRSSLKYVGHSPYDNKKCSNCQFFQAAKDGKPCGSCTIVPGPINPDGHCTSWSPKQT